MNGGNARGIEKLSVTKINAWVKSGNGRKLSDGGGLYLVRLPSGRATWQIKYRINGAEKSFSVGPFDDVSLAEARDARKEAKKLIKVGKDPVQARRLDRAAEVASSGETFNNLADAWLKKEKGEWSAIHYEKSERAIERDVRPLLGKLPVRDITPAMVTEVIESIQRHRVRDAARPRRDTAMKICQHVRSIFAYAKAKGYRDDNPADSTHEVLKKPETVKHRPALFTFPELGNVLRQNDVASISPAVRLCHRLIAFTAVRISNAVAARWREFNLESSPAMWVIPRAQMKVRGRAHDHKVVLPDAFAEELRRWRSALPGDAEFLFPGAQERKAGHLSREAVEKVLRVTLGLADKHSAHGWRASFSTLAKEHFRDAKDDSFDKAVNLALDHIHDNEVARACDRGERLQKRVELAQWWGAELERAQRGADVLPLKRKA